MKGYLALVEAYERNEKELKALSRNAHRAHPGLSELEKEKEQNLNALYYGAQKAEELAQRVFVTGFYVRNPQLSGPVLRRAIGIYERIVAGEPAPEPPDAKAPAASDETPAGKSRWWLNILTVVASGVITAGVNAYWGTAVRCEPNQEFDCRSMNGVEWGARCNPSGVGRTLCMPLWKLRELDPPSAAMAPSSAPPMTSAP
ncbi:MAG: hypothetical protein ABI895_05460 [Deltaproteobacteria bacterium]